MNGDVVSGGDPCQSDTVSVDETGNADLGAGLGFASTRTLIGDDEDMGRCAFSVGFN